MSFAKSLEKRMKEKNITKAELARRIDVADTTVGRYVSGKMRPRRLLLNRILDVLDCSEEDLR